MNNDIDKVKDALQKNRDGLTLTELVNKTKLTITKIRTAVTFLLGSKDIYEQKIGMAKLYRLEKK